MAAPIVIQAALGTGTGNISFTGVGFVPSAVIFVGSYNTGTATAVPGGMGVGFMCADGTQGCVTAATRDHTQGASFVERGLISNTTAFRLLDADATNAGGVFSFVSMDADGFTVSRGTAFAVNVVVNCFCFPPGWSAKVIAAAVTAATGTTQAFTGAGFTPDLVVGLGGLGHTLEDTLGTSRGFSVGWMTSAAQVSAGVNRVSAGTSNWFSILRTTVFMTYPRNDSATERFNLARSSLDSDGFTVTVTRSAGADASILVALCLKAPAGVSVAAGSFAAATGTGNFAAVSGLSFKPAGLLLLSTFLTTTTQTSASSTTGRLAMGMATSTTTRGAVGWDEFNNAGTGTAQTRQDAAKCFYPEIVTATDTPSDGGSQDFVSWDSGGFTLNQVVAAGAANLELYLAIGQAATGPTGGLLTAIFSSDAG